MTKQQVAPVAITNAAALLSAFGYWPSFHDAEVHRTELDRGGEGEDPSITLVVYGRGRNTPWTFLTPFLPQPFYQTQSD